MPERLLLYYSTGTNNPSGKYETALWEKRKGDENNLPIGANDDNFCMN